MSRSFMPTVIRGPKFCDPAVSRNASLHKVIKHSRQNATGVAPTVGPGGRCRQAGYVKTHAP